MAGDDTSVTVEEWDADGSELKKLVLKVGPQFTKEVVTLYVRYRDRFYELKREAIGSCAPREARSFSANLFRASNC